MNTSVQIFNFNQNNVRVQIINDEPFFCLKDVAEILEIKDTKAKNFRLSEKGVEIFPLLTNGGVQQMTFINEPNLYRIIFRSNKAEAVKFQDWIFEEVIPAIRKTGSYSGRLKPQAQRKALPSGLTHEQQAEVKALHNILIQSVPFEKQKALAITLWSAVKSKFKVGYKDVPPEQFPEVLSLMARVAVEKGAQYREAEAVNLETVPKLFANQANIPFDLKRDAHYAVTVKGGKIYRHMLHYFSSPHEDSLIPCLAHQV